MEKEGGVGDRKDGGRREKEGKMMCEIMHGYNITVMYYTNHTYPVSLGTLELSMGTGSTAVGVMEEEVEEATTSLSTSCKLLMDSDNFMWYATSV